MEQQAFNFMKESSRTQKEKVLFELETKGFITNYGAFEIGITQLQSVIRDLRKQFAKEGFKRRIDSIKQKGCNRDGAPVTWTKYVLAENSEVY